VSFYLAFGFAVTGTSHWAVRAGVGLHDQGTGAGIGWLTGRCPCGTGPRSHAALPSVIS
jgi:hypothetical protein